MRRVVIIVAISVAVVVTMFFTMERYRTSEQPYVDALIRLQLEDELGPLSDLFVEESPDIQALMLHYWGNQNLVLRSRIALNMFPETAEKILLKYGDDPGFKEVFDEYGEIVIPVIQYFLDNDLWIAELIHKIKRTWISLWARESNDDDSDVEELDLTPDERGLLSIAIIQNMGYGLLGQFVENEDGKLERVRTEQTFENVIEFFAGGMRTVEEKHRGDETIEVEDILWAAVDVAALAGSLALVSKAAGTLKLMRATKEAVRSGRRVSVTRTSATVGARLLSSAGKVAPRVVRYGVPFAATILIVKHPSLLNSLFAEVGIWMGIPQWMSQIGLWIILLFVLLYPLSWLLVPILRILFRLLEAIIPSPRRSKVAEANVDS